MYSIKQIYVAFLLLLLAGPLHAQVSTGLDRLVASHFSALKGKRIGLITNQTGRTKDGKLGADLFAKSKELSLVALYAPEHGLMGTRKAGVESDTQERFEGISVFSLYGSARKPTKKMLRGVNALVFDLQDIGVRPYTYLSTMVLSMESAAENKIPFYVLDRPNPLSGERVEGNVLDPSLKSFVGMLPIPYLHGMTLGELAKMAKAKAWFHSSQTLNLTVIPMSGWKRSMYWTQTGLPWTASSPNIPHFDNAIGCAILGATGELGVISIGIGTDAPFLRIGSTIMPDGEIKRIVDSTLQAGSTLESFAAQNAGVQKQYQGVHIDIKSPSTIKSFYAPQFKMLEGMMRDTAFRNSFDAIPQSVNSMFEKVTGMHGLIGKLRRCEDLNLEFIRWQRDDDDFRKTSQPYLLY